MGDAFTVRMAEATDRQAIVELCGRALGWDGTDPNDEFFSWKHDDNPLGSSPTWVAVGPNGEIVGVRAFLRWRLIDPSGHVREVVRAVDTATDPAWQGRGVFRSLTLTAIPHLRRDAAAAVFNTPNAQSRPGYLKMGWEVVGRMPVAIAMRSPSSLVKLTGARIAASKWPERTEVGLPTSEAFASGDALAMLLSRVPRSGRIATDRTVEFLRWRYGFEPLGYRVATLGDRLEDGIIVFRIRRRGAAREGTICEVLSPASADTGAMLRRILRTTGADYLIRGGRATTGGFVPVPLLGPTLTWKPICRDGVPAMRDLAFGLGDIELF